MPAAAAPIRLSPQPWRPLTDAEWAALRVWLPQGDPDRPRRGPGRPPRDLRRTVDAIFWVAASQGPWKDLPPALGRPGTAHRTLARWARAGVLERLLVAATQRGGGGATLQGLGWWLARAFRRMAKLVPTAALGRVRDALRLVDAWPANPLILPDRDLSKTLQAGLRTTAKALKLNTMLFVRAHDAADRDGIDRRLRTQRLILRALRTGWKQLRLAVCGNRHQWRLK